jgi:transformation/transcription domain-associated protein
MLRGFAEQLRPYQDSIPKCVIQLLLSCPHECAAIRKVSVYLPRLGHTNKSLNNTYIDLRFQELLIATRHILATEFRAGFVSHIDTLLDEAVLIGTGRTSYETLR